MILSKIENRPPNRHHPGGEVVQEITGLAVGDVASHSLAEVRFPSGGFSEAHYHKISEESCLILAGEARLIVDDREFHLAWGDAVVIQPLEVHQISNPGEKELVFLAVCVPARTPDDSFPAEEMGRE
ncbi:MAG: cupin domain-containing protein [Chloroflexota bacterium]|nr:cupin domain-containing protein [Chloroflexota bacterium]